MDANAPRNMSGSDTRIPLCEWAARGYLERGWSVLPLLPGSKVAAVSWREFQQRHTRPPEVREWFKRCPDFGIGIVTGALSRVVVIDPDTPDGLRAFTDRCSGVPRTRTAATPRDNVQLYFQHPGEGIHVRTCAGLLPGVDVRGDGGYVAAPPTRTAVGVYDLILDVPLLPLPEWIAAKAREKRSEEEGETQKQRGRHVELLRRAGRMRYRGVSEPAIEDALLALNRTLRYDLPEGEVLRIAQTYRGDRA